MKKLFISALAIASLVACSKDELVNQPSPAAIGFAGAFVENATRSVDPSTTNTGENAITAFDVWAFMDKTDGTVFEDQNVEKKNGAWTYSPLQYWTPGHTYYFGALAPMNSENWDLDTANASEFGAGVVSFTNVKGTEDLLYAATSVTTSDDINYQPESVKLTFNHLLSKVKFSFTNGFPANNYWITVSNIQMTAPAAGTIDLAAENWWENKDAWQLTEGEVTLEFGNMEDTQIGRGDKTASAYERLTIPASADQEYVVTFDVELFVGKDAGKAVSALKNTLTTTITGAALEMGKAYNFHAELNAGNIAGGDGDDEDDTLLTPIVFEVQQVKEWVDGKGYDGEKIETEFKSANVSTAAELLNAVEAGASEIKLLENINLGDESLVFTPFDPSVRSTETTTVITDFVLDLNGKAIAATGDAIIVDGGVSLTINGDGAVTAGQNASGNAVWVKYGDVVINGGTYSVGADGDDRNDCIYVGAAAYVADAATKVSSVSIYGGNFSAKVEQSNQYWVLNLRDEFAKAGSTIKVYGGTFTNFNPGNNLSEGKGTNFVAAGYISLPKGENTYEVVELAGEIKLEGNVELAAPLHVYKNVVVDLCGKTISIDREGVEKQDYVFAVFEGGNLTINGEGNVSAGEANTSVAVWAFGGDVTINGGYYTNAGEGCDLIYADKGSVVTINGGTFKAVEREDGVDGTAEKYSALNCKDNSGSSFVVKGGSYYRFNPGANKSENPAVSFVAEGYEAYVIDADWYGVKAK